MNTDFILKCETLVNMDIYFYFMLKLIQKNKVLELYSKIY